MEITRHLWTVGHSNHELAEFIALLTSQAIDFVIDVRSYPYSRYSGQFNREPLEEALGARGIRYVFMGDELGGRPTSDDHYDRDGHALYDRMASLPNFRNAVARLVAGAADHRIALMCSEGQPLDCHRRLLVGKVLCEHGVELRHILPDGSVTTEHHVRLGKPDAQATLFGEDEPQWRSTQSVSHRRRLNDSSDD